MESMKKHYYNEKKRNTRQKKIFNLQLELDFEIERKSYVYSTG